MRDGEFERWLANANRHGYDPTEYLLEEGSFPEQEAFVRDESRYKALLCARRSGKSVAAAMCAVIAAWRYPNSTILITALTTENVNRAFKQTLFKLLDKLPTSYERKGNNFVFPNGSEIELKGAELKNVGDRFRGGHYRLVVVDESQKIPDLYEYVNETLGPALDDEEGTLILAGTPGVGQTYFYHVTHGSHEGANDGVDWRVYKWSRFDNPHMSAQARRKLDNTLKVNPGYTLTAGYKREYTGEWVTDEELRLYRLGDHNRASLAELPAFHSYARSKKGCILGIDLGFDDPTAFVIGRYVEDDPTLYVVHTEQHSNLLLDDVVSMVERLSDTFEIDHMVVDGSKQLVKSLEDRMRSKVPLEKIEKHDKGEHQIMLRGDLERGKVRFLPQSFNTFQQEWQHLVWDKNLKKVGKLVELEAPGIMNHQSDAMLYLWRNATNFMATPKKAEPTRDELDKKKLDDVVRKLSKQKTSRSIEALRDERQLGRARRLM